MLRYRAACIRPSSASPSLPGVPGVPPNAPSGSIRLVVRCSNASPGLRTRTPNQTVESGQRSLLPRAGARHVRVHHGAEPQSRHHQGDIIVTLWAGWYLHGDMRVTLWAGWYLHGTTPADALAIGMLEC
eukprot:9490176-Pyramimonas_sp.AAC.1